MQDEVFEGATAVNAADIEQQIAAATQLPGFDGSTATLQELEQQLLAVAREVKAVKRTLDTPTAADIPHHEHTTEADNLAQNPPSLIRDAVHEAMLKERLAGLEERRSALEQQLVAAGGSVPKEPTTVIIPKRNSVQQQPGPQQQRQQQQRQQQQPGNNKKGATTTAQQTRKRQRNEHAVLQEEDLFAGEDVGSTALVETERDRLIRMGVLTPFDALGGFERRLQETAPAPNQTREQKLSQSLARLSQRINDAQASKPTTKLMHPSDLPAPQRAARKVNEGFWRASTSRGGPVRRQRRSTLPKTSRRSRLRKKKDQKQDDDDDDDLDVIDEEEENSLEDSVEEEDDEEEINLVSEDEQDEEALDRAGEHDDANEDLFKERQAALQRKRRKVGRVPRMIKDALQEGTEAAENGSQLEGEEQQDDEQEEEKGPEDAVFEGGFKIPGDIYERLFDYQRTGVKWMWELHTQRAGGIIGDEMGLGKTIQVIAFLAGLHHSGMFKPSLIVCPATILRQWLREIRAWYPFFRVSILHESSSSGKKNNKSTYATVRDIATSDCGIMITTYDQLRLKRDELLNVRWGYVVLDEGHKIRNPDAAITLVAKQLLTVHRLVMTGSPIQNRLTELWSLFDFVFPGKLGTLPVFEAQFSIPIQIGGYANATALQVSTAYKCAVVLRDLVSPYLLRRKKADVASSLPKKTERVLFCLLTPEQRDLYRSYLSSKELQDILGGNRSALAGIDVLRKICNHPDLLERAHWEGSSAYGDPVKSGKMMVLEKVLTHWKENGDKALVFTQTQQVLDMLENLVSKKGWRYHRMDGATAVGQRAKLVDDFNNNDEVFCFLLTTRVGGLGVNLTGANRCVIFDPDWNPSTDIQARERAWRVGQTREVTVYRLITSGTIEEKVYHRQVYKQFLTERVLKDPRQRRFFKARDMADLFTLGDEYADGTETAEIFSRLNGEITADDLVDERQLMIEGGEQGGAVGSDSDRDDYISGDEGGVNNRQKQQQSRGQRRQSNSNGGSQQQQEATGANNGGGGGDTDILKELLGGSGVHSALDQEVIENAHDPERKAAEQEAAKIAKRAAQALRQSRLQCQTGPVNQPTWTGRSGTTGAPSQPRFGSRVNSRLQPAAGLNSTDILARIRQREQAPTVSPELQRGQALAERIVTFLQSEFNNRASTQRVVEEFQSVSPDDLPLFKKVLKQVADLKRQGGGKMWVLKEEFSMNGS